MRIYVGTTLRGLAALQADGTWSPPLPAHAVTPTLREWYASADLEELEYAALSDAARASIGLLAAELTAGAEVPPRRVVVAVEVEDSGVRPDSALGRSTVQVSAAVPLTRVQAVHVDESDAEPAIRAAAKAWSDALGGDDDAAFVVDEAFGFELLWYARQEIPDILQSHHLDLGPDRPTSGS